MTLALGMCPLGLRLSQAWGLMELQRGNVLAAVLLLERSVAYDPRCSPVLRWKAVCQCLLRLGSASHFHNVSRSNSHVS